MRKIATLFLALGMSFGMFGQETNVDSLKYGPDKGKTEENLSLYNEYYKQKNYKDAYPSWSYIFHNAPLRSRNLYIHGPKMALQFMKDAKAANDTVSQVAWMDSLFIIYDQQVKHYPTKEGANLGKKGVAIYKNFPDQLEDANKLLRASYEKDGNDISRSVINYYFSTSVKLKNKKIYTMDDLLVMYSDLSGVISFQKSKYSGQEFDLTAKSDTVDLSKKEKRTLKNSTKILKTLNDVEANIEKTIGPLLSCDKLSELFTKNFEVNKEDVAWLQRATKLMKKKECTDTDIFFTIAEQQYKLDPNADAAINLAYNALKRKDYSTANTYITNALEQEPDDFKRSGYHYLKARVQMGQGSYSSAKSSAMKAASLRKGWGDPYILVGQVYAATSRKCGELQTEFLKRVGYIAAIEKFEYAKRIDPSCSGKANILIGQFSKHVPSVTDTFSAGFKDGESYTINCWYNEVVKIRTVKSN